MFHKAINPFSLADAKMFGTYLFQETDVTYDPSWGFLFPGFVNMGYSTFLPMSTKINSVDPNAK